MIISLTDGEEGFSNLGTPLLGSNEAPGSKDPALQKLCQEAKGSLENCQYPVGFTHWSLNPTVDDANAIKLIIAADPWGKPGIVGSDFIAVMGIESTPKLQELLSKLWPKEEGTTQPVFANRQYASSNYADMDALSKSYNPMASATTPQLARGGIPFVWMAQTGFQTYHGGMNGPLLLPTLYKLLNAFYQVDMSDILKYPVYYAEDRLCTLDKEAFYKMYSTASKLVRSLADDDELGALDYTKPKVYEQTEAGLMIYTLKDVENNIKGYTFLITALNKPAITGIPVAATEALVKAMTLAKKDLENAFGAQIDSSTDLMGTLIPVDWAPKLPLFTVIVICLDFFRDANKDSLTAFGSSVEAAKPFPKSCPGR